MKKSTLIMMICLMTVALLTSACKSKKQSEIATEPEKSEMQRNVEEFAYFDLKSDLIAGLSDNDKKLLSIFIDIADIMDDLFWKQTFGDKNILDTISDPYTKDYAMIHYGPWDRLREDKPFVAGYGERPLGACYYPQDITKEEFDAFQDKDKNSLYTVIRRNDDGTLKTVWYKDEYKEELTKVCALLDSAIAITDNAGLKKYLEERKKAFETDNYYASDVAWMDMKDNVIDFVVGPIENYDDKLNEAKASYEAFILVKDVERSNALAKFVGMLPALQKELPCEPEYKTFVPGTSSDINVYDAVYYAGDCNAGSKTIAINLPNDERIHEEKGTRRLQLRNSMLAKFDKIMMPIGELVLNPDQLSHLKFDAFFWNVMFHEVGHGLGVKKTINGKGTVDEAMGTERTTWEEAKADILGLFLVCNLIDKGEITTITKEDAITTYIAGIFRSVRFGAGESHGKANMMCFNFMREKGAFTRDANGIYTIDYDKATEAMNEWAALILKTQATGDLEFATQFRQSHASVAAEMQEDLNRINEAGIPRDIRFNQGKTVLGL